jgi:hypothetical protein
MLELLVQFALELIRALLVDELSGRVRRGLTARLGTRGAAGSRRRFKLRLHRRTRDRLLHRLSTDQGDGP